MSFRATPCRRLQRRPQPWQSSQYVRISSHLPVHLATDCHRKSLHCVVDSVKLFVGMFQRVDHGVGSPSCFSVWRAKRTRMTAVSGFIAVVLTRIRLVRIRWAGWFSTALVHLIANQSIFGCGHLIRCHHIAFPPARVAAVDEFTVLGFS
jgi:hypothetical protein